MMRLPMSTAAAGLLRALLKRVGEERHKVLLTACRSVDWQSLTFVGERHQFDFRIERPDAAGLLERLTADLQHAEFAVPGQIVAEIAAGPPRRQEDGSMQVEIEALTIAA